MHDCLLMQSILVINFSEVRLAFINLKLNDIWIKWDFTKKQNIPACFICIEQAGMLMCFFYQSFDIFTEINI